jgi:phosphoribulokinase
LGVTYNRLKNVIKKPGSVGHPEESAMSKKHPVIAVTGSSGAGTTTVKRAFEHIFRRESINAAFVEGDSFHSLTRNEFRAAVEQADRSGKRAPSHFGPEVNHFDKLEECFRSYGETGSCRRRYHIHTNQEASEYSTHYGSELKVGEFTPWEDIPPGSDLLLYEGLHGGVVTEQVNVAQHADLLVGVVPVVNLEWIQKIHRDCKERGYSPEAVTQTIMRRMRDYVDYITPQFSRTHINFQRVATVDTSNPFIAREIPSATESFIVIRFSRPEMANFPALLTMIKDSFMSRPNTIVVPGGKMGLSMELILTPLISKMLDGRG